MIAFFFTMPTSMMMPTKRVDVQLDAEEHQREQRADAGRRQARENRERMDEALVEDAEHDVDHQDRQHQQDAHALQRALERLRRALEAAR